MPEPSAHTPAYLYVPGMSYQIIRDGFHTKSIVNKSLRSAMKIIANCKPDIIIGDGHPMTLLIGRKSSIPIVQIVKSPVHPQPEKLVWWENSPDGLILPDPSPVFNPVFRKNGLPEINFAEQLIDGDCLIIPSIPSLDPMKQIPSKTFYTGAIVTSSEKTATTPDWFSKLNNDLPVVFFTVGGAAGIGGSTRIFELLTKSHSPQEWQTIISTGGKTHPINIPDQKNLHIVKWTPGYETVKRSDLIVFHGGYSRMDILREGKPSIVIPFHSEQEYYGRVMRELGVASLLNISSSSYTRIIKKWHGGNRFLCNRPFSIHAKLEITLTPDQIQDCIRKTLNDKKMNTRCKEVQEELNKLDGCGIALDHISRLVSHV
jgi:UDP:flavonoid glycosyltransferase YjiC (YdhE family)